MTSFTESVKLPSARDMLDRPFAMPQLRLGLRAEYEEQVAGADMPALPDTDSAVHAVRRELEDDEFDRALESLLEGLDDEVARLGEDETPEAAGRRRRHLTRYLAPLADESERALDSFADALEGREVDELRQLSEGELDEVLSRATPLLELENPVFNDFLGKLLKKAKSAVSSVTKKVAAVASKLNPIAAVLRRLKGLVRPLLNRVLLMAIDKLPASLRPEAAKLAARLGQKVEGSATSALTRASGAVATAAMPSIRGLASEFDSEVAAVAVAPPGEAEDLIGDIRAHAARESSVLEDLDAARSRFVAEFETLEDGQDATPLIQEFLPAILPALRLGIRLAGRPRVVNFLAGYLGRLISGYVGPTVAPVLSKAIVNSGLRLMSLEVPDASTGQLYSTEAMDADEAEEADDLSRRPFTTDGRGSPAESRSGQPAAEAFADIVQETLRTVSELADESLEDPVALEAAVVEGFGEAVGSSLPASVLVGQPAEEMSRGSHRGGAWIAMPRGRAKRYAKYSRVIPATITPAVARTIRIFGGRTLDSVLRDAQPGGGPAQVRIHLVQAVPGSRSRRILRSERGGSSGGSQGDPALHPLTPVAAGLLIGDPSLGREISDETAHSGDALEDGERLYYLELEDRPVGGGRSSDIDVVVDDAAREVRLVLFRSETDAQLLASSLRSEGSRGAAVAPVLSAVRPRLAAIAASPARTVRFAGANAAAPAVSDLLSVTAASSSQLTRAMESWLARALGAALVSQREAILAATEKSADGITLTVRMSDPRAFTVVSALLRGRPPVGVGSSVELARALSGPVPVTIDVAPGYRRAQ